MRKHKIGDLVMIKSRAYHSSLIVANPGDICLIRDIIPKSQYTDYTLVNINNGEKFVAWPIDFEFIT